MAENQHPNNDDAVAWKDVFVKYYKHNAPSKVALVSDSLMNKWHGKYDELYQNLESKYGKLKPEPQAQDTPNLNRSAASAGAAPPSAGFDKYLMAPLRGGKKSVDSMRDAVGEMRMEYVRLVSEVSLRDIHNFDEREAITRSSCTPNGKDTRDAQGGGHRTDLAHVQLRLSRVSLRSAPPVYVGLVVSC
jgi:hypothetical protein